MIIRDEDKDVFSLDKWLRNLGLLRGRSLRNKTLNERKRALEKHDFSKKMEMTGSDYDEGGAELINVTSETTYDPESGVFQDKIKFWRYLPVADEESQTLFSLSIQGRRDPSQEPDEIPNIIPDQIWVGGSCIFNGPVAGGKDNPYQSKHRKIIDGIVDLSKRVKEDLNQGKPVRHLARILAGGSETENILARLSGGGAVLSGLSDKGGFEETLTPYFLNMVPKKDEKIIFSVSSLDELKSINGFTFNSVEPLRSLTDEWQETAVDLQTGTRYLTGVEYLQDEETGHHVFRLYSEKDENAPNDNKANFVELARVEYEEISDNQYALVDANFMGGGPGLFETFEDQLNLIGFIQSSSQELAKRRYPNYRSSAVNLNLLEKIQEMGMPPALESGGEFKWIPYFGTNIDKKVENFGDGIGGGNVFIHRGVKANGIISEFRVLHDLPFEPGGPKSDYDGAQPYVPKFDLLVLSHDHFDHATLEYYAWQGWLKGKPVICNKRVMDIVQTRLKKLGVSRELWPRFINYDHPDMIKTGDGQYAYRARDEDGNTRAWIQCCENGTQHSALTDMCTITGCYNDHFNETYLLYGDAFDLTERGFEFANKGLEPLASLAGVSIDIFKKIPRIILHDPTGVTSPGTSPRPEQVKDIWRECLKILDEDEVVFFVPFSTNSLEIQAMHELWSEKGTLRNSVAVNANAQIRDTVINKNGMIPELDVPGIVVPYNKLPQSAYDSADQSIEFYIQTRAERAEKIFRRNTKGASIAEILQKDVHYQVFSYIATESIKARQSGESKPEIIYKIFFSNNENAFEDLAQNRGFAASIKRRTVPNVVRNGLQVAKATRAFMLARHGRDQEADTEFWMLRRLINNGEVRFRDSGFNSTKMHLAIDWEQEEAALRATRTSKKAKEEFRSDYGRLGIVSTGPTGTTEEQFAGAPRAARGDALFDYDELVRRSGFKIEMGRGVWFITQPASAGEEMQKAQDALMIELSKNRNDTVFCAFKNGFKIYNPKDKKERFMKRFRELGWHVDFDAATNQIRVHDQPFHVHGHGFFEDVVNMIKRLPAALHEAIHIPGWTAFKYFQLAVEKAGAKTSIVKPGDFIARQYTVDEDTGRLYMNETDWLTQTYLLIKNFQKYGQGYGGHPQMTIARVQTRNGKNRSNALDVRSRDNDVFHKTTAGVLGNGWARSQEAGASSKHRAYAASSANIQAAGGKPKQPMAAFNLGLRCA